MAIPSEALHRLKAIDPPQWLAPAIELSHTARTASQHLFSSLKPFTPKSPFDQLLIDGFDAEQIWQQIDLQSQPLISSLRREVKRFEKNPEAVSKIFGEKKVVEGEKKVLEESKEEREIQGFDEIGDEDDDVEEFEEDDDEERESEGGETDEGEKKEVGGGGIEDKFLKIKDLQEYLEEDEEREYGLKTSKEKKRKGGNGDVESDADEKGKEGDEEEEDGDEDEDDELGEFGLDVGENEETHKLESARYEDFFGFKKKKDVKRKSELIDGSEDSETGDDEDEAFDSLKKDTLSTHEKELKSLQSKIEQMEKANLEPKTWTMQGEVTAAKRPKNSALEVDLDFEHNVRPAPVITEEVTTSLEDLIQKRILDGRFDDVQKPPSLLSKAPKEVKELDENKSKKGLAEVYEEEYVQKTNLDFTPSFSEEQKKEASMLFKRLCLKLDALSHFHFSPKPVIEDMSIQANVPALTMEEIAPMAVSDAAMLAPEEVFAGKGAIKEDAELTQADKKRRRANKKRKHKAETTKRIVKKAPESTLINGKEAS